MYANALQYKLPELEFLLKLIEKLESKPPSFFDFFVLSS